MGCAVLGILKGLQSSCFHKTVALVQTSEAQVAAYKLKQNYAQD